MYACCRASVTILPCCSVTVPHYYTQWGMLILIHVGQSILTASHLPPSLPPSLPPVKPYRVGPLMLSTSLTGGEMVQGTVYLTDSSTVFITNFQLSTGACKGARGG